MRRPFVILDVFTATPFAGNPLAVVLEAQGLDKARMQAVAREFNLSETVFIEELDRDRKLARIRIFTPNAEIPFAGHPTIGTAVLVGARFDLPPESPLTLLEQVGPVRCHVSANAQGGSARFALPRLPQKDGYGPDTEAIAAALGLSIYDIGFDHMIPVRYDAGLPYTYVPLRDLEAIRRVRIDTAKFMSAFGDRGAAYVFCRQTEQDEHAFHARMFDPGHGIPEDPATGSAVAGLAGLIADFEPLTDGEHAFVIEQGYEMGRPSQIRLTITTRERKLTGAMIAGDAVVVAEGTVRV
jgi:trans-2,3-dihydro-3-hydroxyanthranilate isomerase